MPRVAAPELEDFDWFPARLRDPMTGWLRVVSEVLGLSELAAPIVAEELARAGTDRIVDLCSGGGGPALSLVKTLAAKHARATHLTLTDKFPNEAAFRRAERELPGRVTARLLSTDATAVPEELTGVRTIFNAFHHLPPAVATAVLADAAAKRQPIAMFEIVERSLQGAWMVAGIPLAVLGLMPFVRGLTPSALALTYALPLIPAATTWDGLASCLRAYSHDELREMTGALARPGYGFRVERARVPWRPVYVTAVIGSPR
ncbi:MAG: hypothetical protein IT374_05800 [Polyangiaceae bacterium]|nr:hypothetical protein [Polyangiaceae bacterium]